MKLSREKRFRIALYEDYFVSSSRDENGEWKVRDGYTTEYVDSFFQSKNFRTYFDRKFYPTYKIDQCNFFNGKYYYPETYTKNPMLDGKWFIKPSKGVSGKDIVVTDNVSSTDFKDVIYQKPVENILLYNGRKQDIRFFVTIQTYDGYLRSYIYPEAFVRLAIQDYDENNFDKTVQQTNFCLYTEEYRKKYNCPDKTILELLDDVDYIAMVEDGCPKFTEHEHRDILYEKFKDIIIDFSEEVYSRLNNKTQRNLVHTFGFDVMPDNDLNLWLLEMNEVPGPSVVDEPRLPKNFGNYATILMESMLEEIINPMQEKTNVKPNNFDMVYEKQIKYNKWIFV